MSCDQSSSARQLPPRSLRTYLSDASLHLKFAARALEHAADVTPRSSRKLLRLAGDLSKLAARVDPEAIEKRARRRDGR